MDLLAVTDPGWVFPAVLAFMGTGFSILGTIWVRATISSYRKEDEALAKLRAITARQFGIGTAHSTGTAPGESSRAVSEPVHILED